MIVPRHFVSTNAAGATANFAVGRVVTIKGERWKVTRHGKPIAPYGTIFVYGRRQP